MADKENETEVVDTIEQEDNAVQEEGHDEEWQDELPPEDDFHDQDSPVEEIIDEIPSDEIPETAHEKSKRGKAILFIALVVGAVFIGGLAYLQFSAGESTGTGGAFPVSSVLDIRELKKADKDARKDATSIAPSVAAPAPKLGEGEIERLYETAHTAPAGKTATPSAEGLGLAEESKPLDGISSDMLTSSSDVPVPTKTEEKKPFVEPTLPGAKATQVAKVENIPVVPPQATAVPTPAVAEPPAPGKGTAKSGEAMSADTDERIMKLTSQMDTLQKSLDQMTQKNADLLAQMEQMKKGQSSSAAKKTSSEPASATVTETPAKQESVTTTKPKTVKKPVAKTKKKETAPKEAVAPKQPAWVLRAATPESAWISMSKDSQELQRVSVGEEAPGIGMVKEIRQNGDSWELVGDKGSIK